MFPFTSDDQKDEKDKKELCDDYEKMKRRILINRRKRKRCKRHRLNSQSSEITESDDENLSNDENDDDLSDLSEGKCMRKILISLATSMLIFNDGVCKRDPMGRAVLAHLAWKLAQIFI